ncbi:MAG: sulfite oxidase [Acidobacteriaceae bacterium]|nr:sulfite oxidase [Acidobacteriaceae bacterium]
MASNSNLITKKHHPENLESPCAALDSYLTPNELFYIRNHFEAPRIDVKFWRLTVSGAVQRARDFTYDDLLAMPSRRIVATLECAGNARAFLGGSTPGIDWHLGAVGNAEWRGVPLSLVLAEVGFQHDAQEVVLQGADAGAIDKEPKTPGSIPFARSLPLAKALHDDVLLAYSMNGRELPEAHGFPVRAIVPGWYGMASVKWLIHVLVCREPFAGYFQTFEYSHWERTEGNPTLAPLGPGEVKTEIVRPSSNERLKAGDVYLIRGSSWAGESHVASVSVSVDGGRCWNSAELLDPPQPYCWVRWQYPWNIPADVPSATLMARATDENGRVQPLEHAPEERHYSVHHVLPVTVHIE